MILNQYLCCSKDLTIATRLIAFIGIAVSVLLTTVLLNDTQVGNFGISRNVALAFGLDWRHFHPNASTTDKFDPSGRIVSAIMIFYSVLFFLINVSLLFASIVKCRCYALPWLVCELLGCISKLAALFFHIVTELNELSNVFIVGSLVYIVVMIWWWIVVFSAQAGWPQRRHSIFELGQVRRYSGDKSTGFEDSLLYRTPTFSYTGVYHEIGTPSATFINNADNTNV